MREWFRRPLGLMLLEEESRQLDVVLATLFGYHLLQVGFLNTNTLYTSSRISHRMLLVSDPGPCEGPVNVTSTADALPFANESLDLVLLPHTLEYGTDPHNVLREVDRTLIPEGHVVICGFNPWSLWGLIRLLTGWLGRLPWCGRMISARRLKDWLMLLGFDVVEIHKICHRPPLQRRGMLNKLEFMESLGYRLWPFFGNVYVMVAKKRVATLTPVGRRWPLKRRLIPANATEPSTRTSTRDSL
jgi:SAM-dependent methyltransferase